MGNECSACVHELSKKFDQPDDEIRVTDENYLNLATGDD